MYHVGCEYKDSWKAYYCPSTDYSFVMWEGLDGGRDGDFVKRRIGPWGVYDVIDKVLDLVNGARSTGVCHGYSCLNRANLYHFLLKDSKCLVLIQESLHFFIFVVYNSVFVVYL